MEFSRPEYWSGQTFPSPRDLPNPGFKPRSPALQADSLPTELSGKSLKGTGPILKLRNLKYERDSAAGLEEVGCHV